MSNKRFLLWIDDDHQLLDHAVSRLRENGIAVQVEPSVDKAIEVIKEEKSNIIGVLVDLMMDPGLTLEKYPTEGGFETGYRLVDYLNDNGLLEDLKVRIFTNAQTSSRGYSPSGSEANIPIERKARFRGTRLVEFVKEEFTQKGE